MTFDQDIDLLSCLLERWWANRGLHEHVDRADIKGVSQRLLQCSREAATIWEFAVALRGELWTLGDGHLQIRSMFEDAECAFVSGLGFLPVAEGVALTWIDTANRVVPGGVKPGDLLLEVDGQPVEVWLGAVRLRPGSTRGHRRWNAVLSLSYQERFPGEAPGPSVITLERPDGSRYSIPIEWRSAPRNQPTPNCVRSEVLLPSVGYVEFRSFYCIDKFGQGSDAEFRRQTIHAAEKVRDVKHLIIDLRQNSGGRNQQAQIAAGLCMRGQLEWFRYRHMEPYNGSGQQYPQTERVNVEEWWSSDSAMLEPRSLWFLIGPGCFSTAEVFASAFGNRAGAVFIGQPTGGGAGNPVEFRLPCSGFGVTIPVSAIYMAGTHDIPIETNGIKPDIPVIQTATALRSGCDAVLEKALDSIQQQKSIYA